MANPIILPELRLMLAEGDDQGLRDVVMELHPATVAEWTEGLDVDETWRVLARAPLARQAEVFAYFSLPKQVEMVLGSGRERMGALLEEMASDNRVDLLQMLDPQVVEELLPLVAKAERHDIAMLLSCPEHSAGSVMTTEYASLPANITAGEALQRLRTVAPDNEMIYYIYVIDDERHLLGFISLRDLIMAKPGALVGDLMERDIVSARVDEDREEVAKKLAKYDFLAIPVVDQHNHLVGIVTHDDIIDVLQEEAVEDVQRIGGIAPLRLSYLQTELFTLTWKRGIWLTILFFTALLTTFALKSYDHTMETWPWLVIFIPLVVSTGGNSGNQSATLIITALSTGDVTANDWLRIVKRELAIGAMLGSALGLLGYFIGMLHAPSATQALVVPLTILFVVVCGTLVGSLLPIAFRRLGLDPALMSNPFVAGIIDIVGIVIYMNVAVRILH